MKKIAIIVMAVIGFLIVGTQEASAQENKNIDTKVYKTSVQQAPSKVQETLKKYSNYEIAEVATYTQKSSGNTSENIYKVKVTKGIFSHLLIINENGKVLGIETGEGRM